MKSNNQPFFCKHLFSFGKTLSLPADMLLKILLAIQEAMVLLELKSKKTFKTY